MMRKPRDFDAELKALEDKARALKTRKVQQLGELVIATGADTLTANELAGALIVLAETKRPVGGRHGPGAGPRSFRDGRGEMHRQLTAARTALRRNRAARNRHQAARARHDMRTWQVERRKRTRHLIELGGLVVKAGIVDVTGDDRVIILGALLWMADKLQSDQGERARALWAAKGKQAFEADPVTQERSN
jgi:Conjugal transfer protein TraD